MIISKSYLSQYLCIDIIHQRRATSYKLGKTVFFTQTVVAELSYRCNLLLCSLFPGKCKIDGKVAGISSWYSFNVQPGYLKHIIINMNSLQKLEWWLETDETDANLFVVCCWSLVLTDWLRVTTNNWLARRVVKAGKNFHKSRQRWGEAVQPLCNLMPVETWKADWTPCRCCVQCVQPTIERLRERKEQKLKCWRISKYKTITVNDFL